MASKTIVVGGALAIEGLAESIRGLKKVDAEIPKLIVKITREKAKNPVAATARRKWSAQNINPGKANKAITASGTLAGAAINLRVSAVPTAAAVEYGAHIHYVFGRPVPASELSRRVFKPWRGNQFTVSPGSSTGYVVQDAIRETLPRVEKAWLDEVIKAIDTAVERG